MSNNGAIQLREYLRRRNPAPNEKFDEFLAQVEVFFKLRIKAEQRFQVRQNTAKSRQGALPLDWNEISEIIKTDDESPPENIVTQFSRDYYNSIEEILLALRKVLVRERKKVSLGLVQQVDAQCLRWLTRQPGRDGVEKAGARQRILAVVRQENYNTLENRVFKDFLVRTAQETAIYLRKYERCFPEHEIIQRVKRLRHLCENGMNEPLLGSVGEIRDLPVPNYVLQQERRYSKIWKAYVELIRQAAVAERLWNRRDEVSENLNTLHKETPRHTNHGSRFHAPIWFNPLDGRHELIELPFYLNELTNTHRKFNKNTRQDDLVIDLAGGSLCNDLLIYGRHRNAKPYIQNYARPSIEDKDTGTAFFISELLHKKDGARLRDFMEQLHAQLGGKRWFLLVPDDWDALWQEAVIKAIPLARNQVFLVWRSIAASIGSVPKLQKADEGHEIVVLDILQEGQMQMTRLTLIKTDSGTLVPQRRAYKQGQAHERFKSVKVICIEKKQPDLEYLEGKYNRFAFGRQEEAACLSFIKSANYVILASEGHVEIPDSITQRCAVIGNHNMLEDGVKQFVSCLFDGQIPYYDELEALSLIVQTDDENIIAKTLVEPNEKWPGGRVMETPLLQRAAVLRRGENHVRLLLCMGDKAPNQILRIKRHDFENALEEDHALNLAVRMTPGQGMAIVAVQADFLRSPIELNFLNGMSEKNENGRSLTLSTTESEMLRSFPPDAPHVVADEALWHQVSSDVERWVANPCLHVGSDWFAKAADLYADGAPLPNGLKSIERLRRKNVFGNDPEHRFPIDADFSKMFKKLRQEYDKSTPTSDAQSSYAAVVRVIAWTYQSDNKSFEVIRKKCVERILKYARGQMYERPLPQEYTLCANLCSSKKEWETLWNAISLRLADASNGKNVEEELRLLYNLLQFHPMFLYETQLYCGNECSEMMKRLIYWYSVYNEDGPAGSKRIGYVLKCMLYLLRCRKFDGKVLVTQTRDKSAHENLRRCLSKKPKAQSKRGLHGVLCNYLEGKGTIAGLPTS